MGDYFEDAANGVTGSVNFVDDGFHFFLGIRIDTAEEDLRAPAEIDQLGPFDGALEPGRTHRDDMAQDFDTEVTEKLLDDGADGDARGGFTGAGTFEDIAGIGQVVFDGAGEVGVAGPGARDGLVLRGIAGFDRQRFSPVLPVGVFDNQGDGRADRAAVPDAGYNTSRGRSRSSCVRRGHSPAGGAKVRDRSRRGR